MRIEKRDSVLVTGAAGSLGLETALSLAERGLRVFASARSPVQHAAILDAARERGVAVDTVELDVNDEPSIATALQTIVEASGSLYGVVNIAGIQARGYFEDVDEAEIRRVLDVNLFGTMRVVRHALPYLRAVRRGRIAVMSSIAGRIGSMGLSAYAASKFALEGFAESLALEVQPLGIRVAIIEPGIVRTDIWGKNRRTTPRALDPSGPYYQWFQRAEQEADRLVGSSKLTPADVAAAVARALTDRRPRLRYMVGNRASLVLALRRHLPGELFERLYFGEVVRRVTGRRRMAGPGR